MSRILLSKGVQSKLCFAARELLIVNWADLARYLKVPPSTLANWYKCKRLLPQEIFLKLVNITGISIPNPKPLNKNWGQTKGGQITWRRYGRRPINKHPGYGKNGVSLAKKFPLPSLSSDLAEFVGIMLGDGGITREQISVTLGYTTDKRYVPYIRKLIHRLFKSKTSVYCYTTKDCTRIRSSGINLVKNLLTLGLVIGDKVKQQFDIPDWIFNDKEYMKACIRGLIDTDGCVHRKVKREKNGFEYRSIGITQSSYSIPLQNSILRIFSILGFKTAISGTTIYLCGQEQIERYINEIGFSNPKHIRRFKKFLKNYDWVKVPSKIVIHPLLQYNPQI